MFGVGFLARPLGGIVIGRIGDVQGRKPALILSIGLMAAGTLMTGLIPGYAAIGVAAPILIVLARVLQGFSIGGEAGSAMAFIVEWAAPGKRGFYGSLQQCSSTSGFLLGSAIVALISTLVSTESMSDWGWRIPFFLGALIGPLGLYMSRFVDETPAFRQLKDSRGRLTLPSEVSPLLLVARAFGFTILWTVAFYIFLTYMPTFTKTYVHLSESKALWSNSVGLIAVVLAIPLVGYLSDRVGRRPLLLAGCLCFFILPYPIFSMLLSGPSLAEIMAAQIIFGVVLSLFCGVGPSAISHDDFAVFRLEGEHRPTLRPQAAEGENRPEKELLHKTWPQNFQKSPRYLRRTAGCRSGPPSCPLDPAGLPPSLASAISRRR